MSAAKKKSDDSGICQACDVLGDYMTCSDIPAERPDRTQDKRKDESVKEP